MSFRAVPRGRFRALVNADDGSPVVVGLRGASVLRPPHASGAGTYATLGLPPGEGRLAVVDAAVRGHQKLSFSPVSADRVVVKLARGLAWPAGAAAVDAWLSPGPFGAWGYCLTVTRVAAAEPN